MVDLRTALQDLADERAGDVPPPDLWRRGVRRQRRRRVTVALGAIAVLVVAVLSLVSVDPSLVNPPPPVPADAPSSRLHVPDRIYVPSRWMGDTHEPPGPLAVLTAAKRASSWFGSREGWFGISAVDGSYHWVDLPGSGAGSQPILSPDGTKIGYAVAGDPSGEAYSRIVGFAIYDNTTGHMSTWRIPTRHGLEFDGTYAAGWTSDSRWFAASFGQWKTRNVSNDYRLVAFPSRGGRFRTVGHGTTDLGGQFGIAGPHSLAWIGGTNGQSVVLADVDQRSRTKFWLDRTGDAGPWFSPDGSQFVFIAQGPAGPHSTTNRLFLAHSVSPGAQTHSRLLTARLQPYRILGWVDSKTFLVDAYIEGGDGVHLLTVDARSGEFQHAVKVMHGQASLTPPQLAADLLRNPLVAGVRPPKGIDPWIPASGAAVVALAVFGVWFWRRCVGA